MFGVELFKHGRDAPSCDGLLTAGAEGASFGVVVSFAVGQSVMVKETATTERASAILEQSNRL